MRQIRHFQTNGYEYFYCPRLREREMDAILVWCKDQFGVTGARYTIEASEKHERGSMVWEFIAKFYQPDDAFAFKMRWC